jgi:hypothetical protein
MGTRPSPHEICKKVAEALDALKGGRFTFAVLKHLSGDLETLELDSADDLPDLLVEFLNEIQAANPIPCYVGGRPPQRSYEDEIRGLELWAYSWHSSRLGKQVYLKFAVKNQHYYHVDCHEDMPQE